MYEITPEGKEALNEFGRKWGKIIVCWLVILAIVMYTFPISNSGAEHTCTAEVEGNKITLTVKDASRHDPKALCDQTLQRIEWAQNQKHLFKPEPLTRECNIWFADGVKETVVFPNDRMFSAMCETAKMIASAKQSVEVLKGITNNN